MNLQELFNNDLDEQMPGALKRMGMGLAAATGNRFAKGERAIVQVTKDLSNKIKEWAGAMGGLTVANLEDYPGMKLPGKPGEPQSYVYKLWQDMLAKLEIMYGRDLKIDVDDFEDELLNFVRQRTRNVPVERFSQATRGIDDRTARILTSINDAQLRAWVKKARDDGVDDTNAVLVAAEAELARRGAGTTLPLPLGPGGAQAGATPE